MTIRTLAYSQGDHRTERLVKGITKGSNAVFCAALYYGKSKWTSGASGKALIPRPEEPSMPEFLRHLSDYRIKVCDLSRLKLKQIMSLRSDLKAITAYLYLVRHKSRPKILDKVDCQNLPEVIRLLEAFNDIKLSESTIERVVDVAERTIKMNDLAEAFITAQRDVGRKEESKEAKKRQTELLRKITLQLKERGFTSYDVHEVLHVVEFSVILKWFKEADARGAEDQS